MLQALHRNAANRLLAIHCRSFPQYLTYARPYAPRACREKLECVEQIAEDQRQMSDRIVAALREAEVTPNTGNFPMEFTDTHDLSIDFLLKEAVRYQRQDIASIEECVDRLSGAPQAFALAEEALGMAKGHLDTLEELVTDATPALASNS